MMDLLTDLPAANPAPADLLDRAARLPGMGDADPTTTCGAVDGRPVPTRLLRGGHVDTWADAADAFSDVGFRLHPDTAEFPAVVQLCAPCQDGTFLVATWCEGDLSVSAHATVDDACAWIGVAADTPGSQFAFRR